MGDFVASKNASLYAQVREETQTISMDQLLTHGWGDNRHIALTEFKLGQPCAYKGLNGRWETAWVPLIPKNGRPVLGQTCVLLVSEELASQSDLEELSDRGVVDGIVYRQNPVEKDVFGGTNLSDDRKEFLERENPGVDFAHCLVMNHHQGPSALTFRSRWDLFVVVGSFGVGLLLIPLGLLLWLRSWSRGRKHRREIAVALARERQPQTPNDTKITAATQHAVEQTRIQMDERRRDEEIRL